MQRTRDILLFFCLICVCLFAWSIAAEVNFLPRLADVTWLRWQVLLMAAGVLWVSADALGELRCRCCGAHKILLRALLTRSHELLCERCLNWDPVAFFTPSTTHRS